VIFYALQQLSDRSDDSGRHWLRRLRGHLRAVVIFLVTTAAAAAIGAIVTKSTERATAPPPPEPVEVTVTLVKSGRHGPLEVQATSLTGAESVSDSGEYLTPLAFEHLPPHPDFGDSCSAFGVWAKRAGARDVGTSVDMYLVGGGAETAIVDALRVRVIRRYAAVTGTVLGCPPPQFSASSLPPPRALDIELSKSVPTVTYVETVRAPYHRHCALTNHHGRSRRRCLRPPYGVAEPRERPIRFQLKPGDVEEFAVDAFASRGAYDWVLELGYIYRGQRRWVTIDDKGDPFQTVGGTDHLNAATPVGGGWVPRSPGGP
jgi:hypothetical protein